MSVGDYVRFQRALKGGPTPWAVEEATGVDADTYREIEQRYRTLGTDEELTTLAQYFGVPEQELVDRREWGRRRLSAELVDAREQDRRISLYLRTGDTVTGKVRWSDLGALLLKQENGHEIVIQRHAVERWQLI